MQLTISKSNQALIVPPIDGITTLFPNAPKLPDGRLVIKHGLREMKILQHMGLDCPNPMLLYHKFPGNAEPFDVQKATCKMLVENPRAYVLNAMGTGKTKSALFAWDYLYSQGLCKKLLVVAPLSTLRFTWARECLLTLPHRKSIVLHGSKVQRRELLAQDAEIYIINHAGIRVIAEELKCRADIGVLVLDELAVYRNNSDRSKFMRKFAQKFELCWGMTGSPMPREPTDVWSQCMIITPGSVPAYYTRCRELLMTKKSQYIWIPKPDSTERAFSMMQPSVRYSLDDVTELPECTERTVDVQMSAAQKKVYQGMVNSLSAAVGDKTVVALNAGIARGKLVQAVGGWIYTTYPQYVQLDATERIDALLDFIDGAEHKVLVAVPYRHAIEGLYKIATERSAADGGPIDSCMIHGDTKHREEFFNFFQNTSRYKAMFCHPETVHHGVTLTAADTGIWYLPTDNLEWFIQLNGRFRRYGQKHKQQLIMLQGSPIERRMYSRLRSRQNTQETFLQLVEDATADAN